jgi:hypothetical protein
MRIVILTICALAPARPGNTRYEVREVVIALQHICWIARTVVDDPVMII